MTRKMLYISCCINLSIPALLSLAAALEVVTMTASVAASIAGVAIKTTLGFQCLFPWTIDSSNKSHNAPIIYHMMHHFVTEMCTHVMCTFLLQNGALWVICLMHCGICEMDLLRLNIYHVSIGTHWWNWDSQQRKSTDISAIGCLLWLFWSILTKSQLGKSQHSLLRSTVKYSWRITCVWNWVVPNSNYLMESYQNFMETYATITRKMLYISWNRIIFSGHNSNVFQYLWYQRAVTYELAVIWGHYIYLGSQVKIT